MIFSKFKKVFLSVMLMVLMIMILPSIHAFADYTGSCGDNVTYSFNRSTGTLTISGNGDIYDFNYSPWGQFQNDIKSVVIKDGVTSIGESTFNGCKNLLSVNIPNSVTSISFLAFGCTELNSITIPGSVTEIGEGAFWSCKKLTDVTIGNGLTTIGESAFLGCENLTSVNMGNSVTEIGEGAFFSCTSLRTINIPDSVTFIGETTFNDCTSLTSINISAGNTAYQSINGILFSKDGTKLVKYPEGKHANRYTVNNNVVSIGNYAFYNCTSLQSIIIPNTVTEIDEDAFEGCEDLQLIRMT